MRIFKYLCVIGIVAMSLTSCTDTSDEQIKTQIEQTSDTGGQDDDPVEPDRDDN